MFLLRLVVAVLGVVSMVRVVAVVGVGGAETCNNVFVMVYIGCDGST
jgi:hypothetical protein